MTKETFSNWSKTHAKMSRKGVLTVKQDVITYYRSLNDTTYWKNRFLVFMNSFISPPVTVAKVFTYLLATIVLSTGVYAGIAPSSFARTSAAIKDAVQIVVETSLHAFIPDASRLVQWSEVDENDGEVACDPEDCAGTEKKNEENSDGNKENIVNTLGLKVDVELDARENDDEVFCDGERRDGENCAETLVKDNNEHTVDKKEEKVERTDWLVDVSRVIDWL